MSDCRSEHSFSFYSSNLFFEFPEPSSFTMFLVVTLHDIALELVLLTVVFTLVAVFVALLFSSLWSSMTQEHSIEFLWTLVPTLILVVFSVPSPLTLYAIEDVFSSPFQVFLKAVQWDWEVSYKSDGLSQVHDDWDEFNLGYLPVSGVGSHLQDVSSCLFLPSGSCSLFRLWSDDVLHSFTVPSAGIKLDCIPGKSSEVSVTFLHRGLFSGHCAEICGANHSMIPVEVVSFPFRVFNHIYYGSLFKIWTLGVQVGLSSHRTL